MKPTPGLNHIAPGISEAELKAVRIGSIVRVVWEQKITSARI
jgi:hypothetical protein